MTNQRTKIIDCIMECNLPQTRTQSIDSMARMYTDDLVDVLVTEYYLLREQYDDLLEKANVDSQKLLDMIEKLRQDNQ
jgi:hypothetical protein